MAELRHKCSSEGCLLEKRWDLHSVGQAFKASFGTWPFLSGVKNTKCAPTDLDAALERCGHTLIIESKGGNAPVPGGQKYALRSFVAQGTTVLIQWCATSSSDSVTHFEVWHPNGQIYRCTGDSLERDKYLARWWQNATDNPKLRFQMTQG